MELNINNWGDVEVEFYATLKDGKEKTFTLNLQEVINRKVNKQPLYISFKGHEVADYKRLKQTL